jgi:hypothetical protein
LEDSCSCGFEEDSCGLEDDSCDLTSAWFAESNESAAPEEWAKTSASPRGDTLAGSIADARGNTKPTIHKDRARRSLNGEQTFI